MAELRQKDPDAHKVWLRQVGKQMEHERFMEAARYRMPLKVMRSAQLAALVALVVLSGLAGYALYLDHPWIATLFGTLDVAAILGVFTEIGRTDQSGDDD